MAARLANRVSLTTDAHNAYLTAVGPAFHWDVDCAPLVKLSGASIEGQRRYSPPEVVGVEKSAIIGKPDLDGASTSFVEAHNMTMRQNIRRLTRLTNAHSKKLENHIHAMSLWFFYYNLCRKHTTLTAGRRGIVTTPAMAAAITDRQWKLADLVARMP